ncbi:hypothetical protein CYLTODRAFT_215302 [Cylindrobasidium torrendii FP15055 ss-10]|uniref:Uncharacterized protein n=1 Tax=Cylindrobasidium torrendii FP15055 ss-10 TaxID=1314674 RepID=A0A0D7BGY9_9AGAR|nr:hypothetical protein CYLTODRAFT_215302 [Cylindrobasidium torrendii FP15055 ss-10]
MSTPTPSMCTVDEPTLDRLNLTRRDGIANGTWTQSSLQGPVEPHMYDDWDYPQSQPLASQESEVDVGTPLITPHGSTQWLEDVLSQPASQLPESQSAGPEPFAFDDGFSQVPDDRMDCHPLPELAPAPDIAADKLQVHDSRTSTPLSRLTTPPLSITSPSPRPASPAPRYNLRKRPSPTAHPDEPPTNRPRTRARPPNPRITRNSTNSKTSQSSKNSAPKRSSSRPKSRTRTKRS